MASAQAKSGDEEEKDIYQEIISGMASAIKNGDPVEEIRDMIISNGHFRERLKKWKDQTIGLNILQLAVIEGDAAVVNLLKEFQFDYDYYFDINRQPKTLEDFFLLKKSVVDKFRFYARYKLNLPLHLACKLGNLTIIKLFTDEYDLEFDSLLKEPSLIKLPRNGEESSSTDNVTENPEWISDFIQRQRDIFERNFLRIVQPERASTEQSLGINQPQPMLQNVQCPTEFTSCIDNAHANPRYPYLRGNVDKSTIQRNERFLLSRRLDPSNQVETSISGIGKTPLEICIEEKHVECAMYLAGLQYNCIKDKIQVDYRRNRQFKRYPRVSASSSRRDRKQVRLSEPDIRHCIAQKGFIPLHIAILLNLPDYLKLLLDNGYAYLVNSKDQAGFPSLYIALHKSSECVELLLRYGARTDCIVYHQSPLLWLYEEIGEKKIVKNTELLLQYGADVNVKDLNSNTPLDYLASDFGKTLNWMYHINPTKELHIQNGAVTKENSFKSCMKMLLENGAKTSVLSSNSQVHHTVGHTFILNCSWPNSEFMVKCPEIVYSVLDLFFQYGLDPNVSPTNNETNLLIQLICSCLTPLSIAMQKRFLILFIMNGASLNKLIPPPHHAIEAGPIRIWNVYPLIMAIQEKLSVEVLEMMCMFMTLDAINDCVVSMAEGHLWSRIQMLRSNAPPGTPGISSDIAKYKASWDEFVKKVTTNTRSLKHMCKLSILKSIRGRSRLVEHLELPNLLKQYLVHDESK